MTLYISLHPGVVTHTFSPSTQKAKQDHIESPCQKKIKTKNNNKPALSALLTPQYHAYCPRKTMSLQGALNGGQLTPPALSLLPPAGDPLFSGLSLQVIVQLGSGNPASVKNEYLCKVPLGTELTNRRLTTKELQGLCSNLIIFNSNKSPYSFYPLTECTPSCMFFRVTVALGIETDTPRKL